MLELLRIIDNYERLVQYLLKDVITEPVIEEGFSLYQYLDDWDKKLTLRALESSKNQSQAAKLLGIAPRMLVYRMKKFNINVKRS